MSRGEIGGRRKRLRRAWWGRTPKSFELRFAYARILVLEHKDDQADVIAKQLDKENPNSPEVAVLNASLMLNRGKVNDAFAVLQKAVKSSPDNLPLLLAFSKVSQLKGDEGDCRIDVARWVRCAKLSPNNLEVQQGLAEVANRKHDYSMLLQVAEATLAKNPAYPQALAWRGTAEANAKEYDKAEADFRARAG